MFFVLCSLWFNKDYWQAKDYFYKDSVKNIIFTTCGYYTNENRKLNQEICKKIGISFENVYLFPWENYEEELSMLNNTKFEYENQKEFYMNGEH